MIVIVAQKPIQNKQFFVNCELVLLVHSTKKLPYLSKTVYIPLSNHVSSEAIKRKQQAGRQKEQSFGALFFCQILAILC